MKKVKLLVSFAVTAFMVFGWHSTASAKIKGYAIKNLKTNNIRQYDAEELAQSFLDYSEGVGEGTLYKEFETESEENGIHALQDSSKKYVNYNSALKQSEENTKGGAKFELNSYLGEAKADTTPDYVYNRKIKEGQVVSGLNITKDGFIADFNDGSFEEFEDLYVTGSDVAVTNGTVKGEIILDSDGIVIVKNIKGQSIKAVAGDIQLTSVEAEALTVKGNKEIKVASKEGTNIKNTKVQSYAVIDSKAGNLGNVTITVDEKGSKTVELKGTFTQPVIVKTGVELKVDKDAKLAKVEIDAPKGVEIKLSGNVGKVEIKNQINIKLEEGTKADITATGEGKKSVINASKNTDVKVSDITDIKGDGASNVQNGSSTSSGGASGGSSGGSSTATQISNNRATLKTAISSIVTATSNFDNALYNTNGYFDLSAPNSSNVINAKINYPSTTIYGIKNNINSSNIADALATLSAYNSFRTALTNNIDNYAAIRSDMETEIENTMDSVNKPGLSYDDNMSPMLNIINLFDATTEAELREALNDKTSYTLSSGITVKGYEVSSIKVKGNSTTEIYNKTNKTISKATIRTAFGIDPNEDKDFAFGDLNGKSVEITLTRSDAYADTVVYTINFSQ